MLMRNDTTTEAERAIAWHMWQWIAGRINENNQFMNGLDTEQQFQMLTPNVNLMQVIVRNYFGRKTITLNLIKPNRDAIESTWYQYGQLDMEIMERFVARCLAQ